MDKKLSANYSLEIRENGETFILYREKLVHFLGIDVEVTKVIEHTENAISFRYTRRGSVERLCLCICGYCIPQLIREVDFKLKVRNGIEYYFINARDGIHILYNPTVNKWWSLKQEPNWWYKDEAIKCAKFAQKYYGG